MSIKMHVQFDPATLLQSFSPREIFTLLYKGIHCTTASNSGEHDIREVSVSREIVR